MNESKSAQVSARLRIGVLAVQGAFIEHEQILTKLGVETVEIRQKSDLTPRAVSSCAEQSPAESGCPFDGLILPGGESTVQGKLLRDLGLFEPLQKMIQNGLPVFGTCAGLILLAEQLSNDSNVYFGTLPVTVQRNAYGRQLGSFFAELPFRGVTETATNESAMPATDKPAKPTTNKPDAVTVPMTFIRAPLIESVRDGVEILAEAKGGIVAVRYKNQLGITFHPELNEDTRIHQYFLKMCR
ncbi:MAG: pyridoxal 5'-phosphate synthase glutaminase subunit PdxT [Fibrobacter sp.]|nr:pyridoxal 5'-phosphate synthase glutaminase subunit PdxT [Fibrobacter sp.]